MTKPLSATDGVKVTVRVAESYVVEPATALPISSLRESPAVPAWRGLVNVALTEVDRATLLEPASGHWLVAASGESSTVVKVTST